MTVPMHLIKKRLNERKAAKTKSRRKQLKELKFVPVGSFKDGARVTYDLLGPCTLVRHEDNKVILKCDRYGKLYRVPSTTLVAPIQDKKPDTAKNPDLVFRPSSGASRQQTSGSDKPPDLSKYSVQQLKNSIIGLKDRKEAEYIAGNTEKLKKTNQLINYLTDYLKKHEHEHDEKRAQSMSESTADASPEFCNKLIEQWLGTNMDKNSANTKVQIVSGPQTAINCFGYVSESTVVTATGKKMFVVEFTDRNGKNKTMHLPGTSLRIVKESAVVEDNNSNYVYAQMCDIAAKLSGVHEDVSMFEDIDLTKMTTGALQKHYIANQDKASQSPTYAAHLEKVKRELKNRKLAMESTGKKAPTEKQVQAAKDRYDAMGLRIERARAKPGYSRGSGVVGELQKKKGELHSIYTELKREYDAAKKEVISEVAQLTLPELRTKQKQLQQLQMRTDLNPEQKSKLTRIKASLYSQARQCGLEDYIAEMSVTDYRQRRRALQQIQMDPDTALDPQLKKAVISRLAQLNADAKQSGIEIMEDGQEPLQVGDNVVITGNVQFKDSKGVIDQFGSGNKFVVVDLNEHGKHSFQTSDVSLDPAYDPELDEDFSNMMAGIKRSFSGKPSVEQIKRRHFDRGNAARKQGDGRTASKEFNRYLKVASLANDSTVEE